MRHDMNGYMHAFCFRFLCVSQRAFYPPSRGKVILLKRQARKSPADKAPAGTAGPAHCLACCSAMRRACSAILHADQYSALQAPCPGSSGQRASSAVDVGETAPPSLVPQPGTAPPIALFWIAWRCIYNICAAFIQHDGVWASKFRFRRACECAGGRRAGGHHQCHHGMLSGRYWVRRRRIAERFGWVYINN